MRNAEFRMRNTAAALLACLLFEAHICTAQQTTAISDTEISSLQDELVEGVRGPTSVDVRRTCKSVIRKAETILDASPAAPNRYALLAVIFDGQKRLLSLAATEQNRAAIFETCAKLRDAPDAYAGPRFEADMILSERELAQAEATVAQRVTVLKDTLAKYRGTAAEWKSLMVGSMIAAKLLDFDLEKQIGDTMAERFGGEHKVIEFRRKQDLGAHVDAVFGGIFKRHDGRTLVFPNDRIGHQYVVYFWSQTTAEIDKHLAAVKELQSRHPGRFDVYSFNLDDLPDAGEKKLRSLGLDWPAMHVPHGRESSAYRAYAKTDPYAVFVNGQGHVLLKPPPGKTPTHDWHGRRIPTQELVLGGKNLPDIEATLDDERYLAQLRYLFNGDFLIEDAEDADSIPDETLAAIQACFVRPPFRYRLSQGDSLSNYRKAEALCAAAIQAHPKASGIWAVRNRRIIALIGMGNLAGEPKYLAEAVQEAKNVWGTAVPPLDPSKGKESGETAGQGRVGMPAGADVVARFCLAKAALRSGGDPEIILSEFIEQAGADKAPPAALAAAAVLALEANARTAHDMYRQRLLALEGDGGPALWSVYAFLRDSHHCYRNFWASPGGFGFGRPQKYEFRNMVSGLAAPVDRNRRARFELKEVGGGTIRIPDVAKGEMLGIVFAEPPADKAARSNLVNRINGFVRSYTKHGTKVIVVLLSEDANIIGSMTQGLEPVHRVGVLPDGLKNAIVRKLGILSADRIPSLLLFRPDGTVAWNICGLEYRAFGQTGHAMERAIGANIEKLRSDPGFEALEKGHFKQALELLGAFQPTSGTPDYWASDRAHGRALAQIGLKDWDAALAEIDAALERRLTVFKSGICKCHGVVEMHLTKATILEKLGRGREAAEQRGLAGKQSIPHAKLPAGVARQGVPVGAYYDWLKRIRLGMLESSE